MGPRSDDRGNLDAVSSRAAARSASMGPRSDDRGNEGLCAEVRVVSELQWGRDQMIAEMITSSLSTTIGCRLQWGRDQMIAEMGLGPAFSQAWCSLQWGRDQMIAEIAGAAAGAVDVGGLQWGRDQMIAEISHGIRRLEWCCVASMGPRSDDRGNGPSHSGPVVGIHASMGPRSDDRGN